MPEKTLMTRWWSRRAERAGPTHLQGEPWVGSESGFTLVELLVTSVVTLTAVGVAFATFSDALTLNDTTVQVADASQNLRAGSNLVDGTYNPVGIPSLPYTANSMTYGPSQIRKVNIHLGVRSELKSPKHDDYLRSHVSTVISLRNLAYVARYR